MALLKFCKKYILSFKLLFYTYAFLKILSNGILLYLPILTAHFIDNLTGVMSLNLMTRQSVIFLSLNTVLMIIEYANNYVYVKLQTLAGYKLNLDVLNHLKQVSILNFKNLNSAYLTQRINNDSNAIIIFFIDTTIQSFINIFILIYTTIILVNLNIIIGLVLIFSGALYVIIYKIFKTPLYNKSFNYKESQANFFSKLTEQISFIHFIKSHSVEILFENRLFKSFKNFLSTTIQYQKVYYLSSSIDNIINFISQFIIYFLGGLFIINGNLTVGMFTVIISYFSTSQNSLKYFFNVGKNYQESLASLNRIQELLNIDREHLGNDNIKDIYSIKLVNINFKYSEKIIFNDFNLTLVKGNIYLVKGDNGSGKSTLINLIMGLYIGNYTGKILYNDIDINDINISQLRRKNISLVEQEPTLIMDSLLLNLTLSEQYCEEELNYFIEQVGLSQYISNLKDGFNTQIQEDSENVSGGEKQKISLVRQFMKDSNLVILDEPTSALDKKSKQMLFKELQRIKDNKIIIIVSHESIIEKFADKIVTL